VIARFVLQMAGHPGSGKSTLARAVGEATGAVVLDKDVIKTGLLENGVPEETAASLAYDLFFRTGRAIAEQGFCLILDSPAFFTMIPEQGRAIADANDAAYYIIECAVPDRAELQRRLDARTRVASQSTITVLDDPYFRPGSAPLTVPHLQIDMSRPLDDCLAEALTYIGIQPPVPTSKFPVPGSSR
jgi:predicted kinase